MGSTRLGRRSIARRQALVAIVYSQERSELRPSKRGSPRQPGRVVHLELHTNDLCGASAFYGELLRWRTEQIDIRSGSYHALTLGGGLGGGIVECGVPHPRWLPYVDVEDVAAMTERARGLGASVLLEPREGPAGWRSVLGSAEGGEIALWQSKRQLLRGAG